MEELVEELKRKNVQLQIQVEEGKRREEMQRSAIGKLVSENISLRHEVRQLKGLEDPV